MNLFLDDKRKVEDVDYLQVPLPSGPWTVVKSYGNFVTYIQKNPLPDFISFDCDLDEEHYPWHPVTAPYFERGEIPYDKYKEKTGRDCALFLVEHCQKNNLPLPKYAIHSMNVVARKHVKEILEAYGKSRN